MIPVFFKHDLLDNIKTWLGCTLAVLLLFVALYLSSTLMETRGSLILSPSFTMFVNLIPLIYLINAGNNLVVNKIDNGSFYLDMVSGYKRRNILLTKMIYYISSLLVIYLLILLAGVICIASKPTDILTYQNLVLLCGMSFLLNLSISSIIFCSSSFFNAKRYATLVGAGIPLLSYVFNTISNMFTNIPGLEDNTLISILTKLKYISFHSLFNYEEIVAATNYNWIGFSVFLGISLFFYSSSFVIFTKKDLPL